MSDGSCKYDEDHHQSPVDTVILSAPVASGQGTGTLVTITGGHWSVVSHSQGIPEHIRGKTVSPVSHHHGASNIYSEFYHII